MIYGKYIAESGRYLLTEDDNPEHEIKQPLHAALAEVMYKEFGKDHLVYMSVAEDFGRSVQIGIVDKKKKRGQEVFVVVLSLKWVRDNT